MGTHGQPDADYLKKTRARFGQWMLVTAEANYDQRWLDYSSRSVVATIG